MKTYKSPVYNVQAIPLEKIQANAYNPNHVAKPEMKLLYKTMEYKVLITALFSYFEI